MKPDPFAGRGATALQLLVLVDGVPYLEGALELTHYPHEPEALALARHAAALRAELLTIADGLAERHAHTTVQGGNVRPPELTHDDIDVRFGFHTAAGRPDVAERHDYVRYLCRELAHALLDQLPDGPDKTLAIIDLESVMMRANRAIAIGYREAPAAPPPAPRPVPRPPSAYQASRPQTYRGAGGGRSVPAPRPAGDDKGATT